MNMFKGKLLQYFVTPFTRKSAQVKEGPYLGSPEFLRDIRRAAEKGAEAQDRVMKEAGMQWPSEVAGKK